MKHVRIFMALTLMLFLLGAAGNVFAQNAIRPCRTIVACLARTSVAQSATQRCCALALSIMRSG